MTYNPENGDSAGMGTGDQFPYMIKAEWDGADTVTLTPLKIPNQMTELASGHRTIGMTTYLDYLYLCLEVSVARSSHLRHGKGKSYVRCKPTKTGKFYVPYSNMDNIPGEPIRNTLYVIQNPLKNCSYTFDLNNAFISSHAKSHLNRYEPIYIYVRGCYRIYNVNVLRRTCIHSNTIKVTEQ